MKPRLHYIMAAALTLAACGPQHDAETTVDDFMKANMAEPTSITAVEYGKMDSTKHVTDSMVSYMRAEANASKTYKTPIAYAPGAATDKVYYIRVTYQLGDQKHSDTFYLDETLSRVLAFKTN